MNNNPAPQARFFMGITWLLLSLSLLLLAAIAPSAPFAFIGLVFLALLYRIIRRYILYRLDLQEVPTRLVQGDPLGPMIDQIFDRAATGKTVRLTASDEERRHA